MALIQIHDPKAKLSRSPARAVGIDLGTTHSLVATVRNGKACTLPDSSGNDILPSVVSYPPEQPPLTGHSALAAAAQVPPIHSIKRMLGRPIGALQEFSKRLPFPLYQPPESHVPRLDMGHCQLTAIEISALLLSHLKERAEKALAGAIEGVVLTVPAYFGEAQRQATKDAARLAGLPLLRLLNEPTAAALAYGLEEEEEGVVAIYDLGGGTFDLSLLRLQKGIFEVLATAGDTELGGDDMDRLLLEWFCRHQEVVPEQSESLQLQQDMRRLRERLSTEEAVDFVCILKQGRYALTIERQQIDHLLLGLIDKTLSICASGLRDIGLQAGAIDRVILVGGTTRMPLIREKVADFFAPAKLLHHLDPERTVALGAALQADVLAGNKGHDTLLLDVVPLSLGLETMGGVVDVLIPRNSSIPIRAERLYTTYLEQQRGIAFHVVQGEHEQVDTCHSLGRFELTDLAPLAAGEARIQVCFQFDADGLLTVTARDMKNNQQHSLQVKPSHGLREGEIKGMLQERAKRDLAISEDRLQEAHSEAQQVLLQWADRMAQEGLSSQQKKVLQELQENLKAACSADDSESISAVLEQIQRACNS